MMMMMMSGRTTTSTPNTSAVPEVTAAAAVASKGALQVVTAANISIPTMITDRLQDIAVTNSLRHRRKKRMMMMMTTTTKKTSCISSSSRAEKIIKRRERTRSYQRYKLSSLTLKAMKMRVGRKRRSCNKETDAGCMPLQRRRVLRRPSMLQSLSPRSIQVYHPTEKRPYTVSSHTSHSISTDTPLIDTATATAVQTLTVAPVLCYRLSTHIWYAKRMSMQRITCRIPGGSMYSEQRCVYVPSRHRGRGLKAVLKVIGSNRSVDEKEKQKEKDDDSGGGDDTSGVASKVRYAYSCSCSPSWTMTMELQ